MTNPDPKEQGLYAIPVESLHPQLQDVTARNTPRYDAEQGRRASDAALVFHFFPPGYFTDVYAEWPDWEDFRNRLESAALCCFEHGTIDGGYAQELRSFYVIVSPPPIVPDLTSLIERFYSSLELGLHTASGN